MLGRFMSNGDVDEFLRKPSQKCASGPPDFPPDFVIEFCWNF